ncbi:MAG: hypothetical protein JWR20_963 [Marmoricola sp.]|nr:hypothetical protein [Marmoricola sp.]
MTGLEDPTALLGTWVLDRDVEDRRAGERHRVEGTLELGADAPDRIRWTESGTWHHPGGAVEVSRQLWLERAAGSGGDWWVRFEDGRDFHPWRPGEEVVHPCAPDTYRGLVTGTLQGWEITWVVTGPAKDHTLRTRLTRPADEPRTG